MFHIIAGISYLYNWPLRERNKTSKDKFEEKIWKLWRYIAINASRINEWLNAASLPMDPDICINISESWKLLET